VRAPAMVLALGELLVIFAKEKIENACSGLSLGFLECCPKPLLPLVPVVTSCASIGLVDGDVWHGSRAEGARSQSSQSMS